MEKSNNHIFEAYYFGQMSEIDKNNFSNRLANDSKLAAEYKDFSQVIGGVLSTFSNDDKEINPYGVDEEKRIFQFIHGDLNKEESGEIQKRINQDSDYAQFVEEQKEILDILDTETPDDLIEYVRSGKPNITLGDEIQMIPATASSKKEATIVEMPRPSKWWMLRIAASFLLVISITAGWYYSQNKYIDNDELIAYSLEEDSTKDYIEEYLERQVGFHQSESSKNSIWIESLERLKNGELDEAEVLLRSLPDSISNREEAQFFLAIALMNSKKLDDDKIKKAIELLETLEERNPDEAIVKWNLTIAYLLTKETKHIAKKRLEGDVHPAYLFKDKTQKLLETQF